METGTSETSRRSDRRRLKVSLLVHTPCPDDVCDMAARICVSKAFPGGPSEGHRSLRAAMRSGHLSVCEHATFTFVIEGVSRVTTHQLVRHRMASYEQQSQRYVAFDDVEGILPDSVAVELSKDADLRYMHDITDETLSYLCDGLRSKGVPEEDIRYLYPGGMPTNIMVTMNGRSCYNFFMLRCCNRAQWEIREVANRMLAEVKAVAPVMFENAGASCDVLGYCPELRSCGKCQKHKILQEKDITT